MKGTSGWGKEENRMRYRRRSVAEIGTDANSDIDRQRLESRNGGSRANYSHWAD